MISRIASITEPLRARGAFVWVCLVTGIAHVGEVSQKNVIVGVIVLLSVFGVIITPAIVPVTRVPAYVAGAVVFGLVVIDGAFIKWKKAHAAEPSVQTSPALAQALSDHRRDLIEHADTLSSGDLSEVFSRQGNPKYDLLYEGLQAHFPKLAALDEEIGEAVRDSNWAAERMKQSVEREAASVGFGPSTAGLQLLNVEASSFVQTGSPHFDDKWQVDIRDGSVKFDGYNLGAWRIAETESDADRIKKQLLEVLNAVRGLPEVEQAREAMRKFRRLEADRRELLTEISVTHLLPGRCKLCP